MTESLRQQAIDKTRINDTLLCCWYCGEPLDPKQTEIEHQTPRSRGGKDKIDNLVAACRNCNRRKRTRTLDEYREYIADLLRDRLTELCYSFTATTTEKEGGNAEVHSDWTQQGIYGQSITFYGDNPHSYR